MREKQEDLARLGTFIEQRADELGRMWAQVAADAGITVQTLRLVRLGANPPSRGTKLGLEQALRWAPGSVNRVLQGGDPVPLPEPRESGAMTNQELIAASHADLDAIEAELDRRLRRARREPEQMAAVVETLREIQGEEDSP